MDKAPTEMFDIYFTASVAMMSGRIKDVLLFMQKLRNYTIKITLQTQYAI